MKSHVPFCLLLSLVLACASCKRASGEPSADPAPDAGSETKSDRATGQPDDAAWRRERSLDPFYERVAEDLRSGKPLIVAAYYGMWFQNENQPEKNLNWGMRFGHATMMRRADSDDPIAKHYEQTDWELAVEQKRDRSPLRTLVFESEIAPNDRWREEGVVEPFTTYLVMQAFSSREEAGLAMVENLRRGTARTLEIDDGQRLDLADKTYKYFQHLTKPDRDIGDLFVSHGYRMYPDG